MGLLSVGNTDIFSATIQQPAQLESLANNALSKGIDLYRHQDYEGAIREFRRSIGLAPHSTYSTDASNYMANAYMALGDTDGAVKAYKNALRLSPNQDDTYISLGNLYFADGKYDEAAEAYEKAVKIWPSSDNHYALGQAYLYLNAGRYSEADREFNTVLRMEPDKPGGYYGLGLNLSKQGRYEDAILQFKEAIRIDPKFYNGYAELGYAHADLGEMDEAQRIVEILEPIAPELADTLSRHMYKVDTPKFMFAFANEGFNYHLPNAEKTFKMIFQFDKEMDRESVENVLNWNIGRSTQSGPGQAYNYGYPLPNTEVTLPPIPKSVYYDEEDLTATVYFDIRQNAAGDGTIDPAHIEFTFTGEDAYGNKMNPKYDQFLGFSGVA
jgi:tetratricopeptide (TPR) repeat protein